MAGDCMQFWRRVIFAGLAALFMQGFCLIEFAHASTTAGRQSLVNAELPNAPEPQTPAGQTQKNPGTTNREPNKSVHNSRQQPKRILGIMPNYRAVSARAIPPPPTPAEGFRGATENSFDYSSFVFVGLTSLIAKGEDAHPDLGKGALGYWAYAWRGFVDQADGNYLVIWALPTVFHEDDSFLCQRRGAEVQSRYLCGQPRSHHTRLSRREYVQCIRSIWPRHSAGSFALLLSERRPDRGRILRKIWLRRHAGCGHQRLPRILA